MVNLKHSAMGLYFNDEFLDMYWYLEEPEKIHSYLQT